MVNNILNFIAVILQLVIIGYMSAVYGLRAGLILIAGILLNAFQSALMEK